MKSILTSLLLLLLLSCGNSPVVQPSTNIDSLKKVVGRVDSTTQKLVVDVKSRSTLTDLQKMQIQVDTLNRRLADLTALLTTLKKRSLALSTADFRIDSTQATAVAYIKVKSTAKVAQLQKQVNDLQDILVSQIIDRDSTERAILKRIATP